jgi:myo-inositol 2-dehydrogenase / D-chiro-inositol 1-dehydrogenase
MHGTARRVSNRIVGTRGAAEINPGNSLVTTHDGEILLRRGEPGNNPYVQTHIDLVASIREGKPLNETRAVAESTLTGILGREAAYTGQSLTWDEVYQAEMSLVPDEFSSGTMPAFEVAKPGVTSLARSFPAASAG